MSKLRDMIGAFALVATTVATVLLAAYTDLSHIYWIWPQVPGWLSIVILYFNDQSETFHKMMEIVNDSRQNFYIRFVVFWGSMIYLMVSAILWQVIVIYRAARRGSEKQQRPLKVA